MMKSNIIRKKRELAQQIVEKDTLEKVKQKIRTCYLGRLGNVPEDIMGSIASYEEDPWKVVKLIEAGIYPEFTHLHFVGRYKISKMFKWNMVKNYNIKSLSLNIPNLTNLSELPTNLETLILKDLPNLTSIPKLPVRLHSVIIQELPKLTSIPKLPDGLETLILIDLPKLTSIPKLPVGLEMIVIQDLPRLTSIIVDLKFNTDLIPDSFVTKIRYE